jgi:arginyl-tRNA synthetase
MGLNITKFKRYPGTNRSIVVTASEQNAYFKVMIKALGEIDANVGAKTEHIGGGMMRFAEGKMSSRTGNVITAEALLADIKGLVAEKIAGREFSAAEAEELAMTVAVAAIRYTILRTSIGSDIIFDSTKSISFEGDSGPYLQYSAVRAQSVLEKAKSLGLSTDSKTDAKTDATAVSPMTLPEKVGLLERLISRFPDIAERAAHEYAPQHIASYLIELAGAFNAFYANSTIIDANEPLSPYRLALTRAFLATMTDGLWLLGIKVPKKM